MTASPSSFRLSTELWLHRHGWAWPLAAVLAVIAAAWWVLRVAPAEAGIATLQHQLQTPRPPAPVVPKSPVLPPAQALRALLVAAPPLTEQLADVDILARRHGITLPRGQYTQQVLRPSGLHQAEVTLTFQAGYPATRAFVEDLLRSLPNAAVDRMALERDDAEGGRADVSLRLTFWREAPTVGSSR